MTLSSRSRAVRDAGATREIALGVMAIGSVAALAGALVADLPELLTIVATFSLGLVIGHLLTNPTRLYMEGFTDGAISAERLAELDTRTSAGRVPELPASPRDDEPAGAAERAQRGLRRHRAPGEPVIDLGAAAGISLEQGPPRPHLGPDGEPLRALPRPTGTFPRLPTTDELVAAALRHVEDGASAGGEAGGSLGS